MVVDSLHHFCDQETSIRDLLRVLRTGGLLLIEEPDISKPIVRFAALVEKMLLMRSSFFPIQTISNMIQDAGQIEIQIHPGRFRSWIVARKST